MESLGVRIRPSSGGIEVVDEENGGGHADGAGRDRQIDHRVARREQAENPEHDPEPGAHRQHERPRDGVLRRFQQLAPGAQRLVDLVGERVRESLPEVVGRVELVDRSVDQNEKSSKLLALAARFILELRISPGGAAASRQLSAITAATYFRSVARIGSTSGPYSRR